MFWFLRLRRRGAAGAASARSDIRTSAPHPINRLRRFRDKGEEDMRSVDSFGGAPSGQQNGDRFANAKWRRMARLHGKREKGEAGEPGFHSRRCALKLV
ncbi:hypothetical protein GCM10007856_43100 [Azospirillum oryzae]|nr:hypothetical protein GCM10007856_43100 [Azospirillum oryzae]